MLSLEQLWRWSSLSSASSSAVNPPGQRVMTIFPRFSGDTGSCVRQGDRAAALVPSTVVRTRSSAAAVELGSSSHLTEMHRFICRHDIQGSLVPEWLPSISGPDQGSSPSIPGGPVLQCSSRGWGVHSRRLNLEPSSPVLGCFYRRGIPCGKTHSASVSWSES